MDWPTAAVCIVAIASMLAAYLRTISIPPDEQTEAIGFHVGQTDGADDVDDE